MERANPGGISAQTLRLGEALRRQGGGDHDPSTLVRIVDEWARVGDSLAPPLQTLGGVLRAAGITLDDRAIPEVAWALLGMPVRGQTRLGDARWSRLTHLTELHDVALPSTARGVARQLAQEVHLVPDLLHARPRLRGVGLGRAEEVLAALFEQEWSGFLALLGEFGPWVYAPSVADLQILSHRYAQLVRDAAESPEEEVLNAALQLHSPGISLLTRLEATDYRSPAKNLRPTLVPEPRTRHLAEAEQAFWAAAELQARRRVEEREARRRRPG